MNSPHPNCKDCKRCSSLWLWELLPWRWSARTKWEECRSDPCGSNYHIWDNQHPNPQNFGRHPFHGPKNQLYGVRNRWILKCCYIWSRNVKVPYHIVRMSIHQRSSTCQIRSLGYANRLQRQPFHEGTSSCLQPVCPFYRDHRTSSHLGRHIRIPSLEGHTRRRASHGQAANAQKHRSRRNSSYSVGTISYFSTNTWHLTDVVEKLTHPICGVLARPLSIASTTATEAATTSALLDSMLYLQD